MAAWARDHQPQRLRMYRMGHAHRHHPDLVALARMCITKIAILPRAFPACNLPGFACLAPAIKQLVTLLPAQHKPNVVVEHQAQMWATGELTIPEMADITAPRLDTAVEQLPQLGLLVTGTLTTARPPLHRCKRGRATPSKNQQPQPVQTRHTDWATARWVEETGTDTFEATRLAGAHRAQVIILDRLGLFQHAAIPDQQHVLARATECLDSRISLLPQPIGKQAGLPALGAQQIAEALGASRGLLGRKQVGTKFAEE